MRQDALARYFESQRQIKFAAGAFLLMAGEDADTVFFIHHGRVKEYMITESGDNKLIAIKGPGDVIPLELLFHERPSILFYQTISNTVTYAVPRHRFQDALSNDRELGSAVLNNTLAVVRRYTKRLQNLELKTARHRIVFRLLDLAKRLGRKSQTVSDDIVVPLNHQDLADATNTTRDTANREVSRLAKEGVVKKRRGVIIVPNIAKLQSKLE